MDQARRKTIKQLAALGTAATVAPGLLSATETRISPKQFYNLPTGDLAEIEARTQISAINNDLEIVLTNTGNATARITNLTPSEIRTARGTFNFDALLESGDLELAEGESVTVPLQHHPVVLDGSGLDASGLGRRSSLLSDALAQRLSIITDGDSLAAVTLVNNTIAA